MTRWRHRIATGALCAGLAAGADALLVSSAAGAASRAPSASGPQLTGMNAIDKARRTSALAMTCLMSTLLLAACSAHPIARTVNTGAGATGGPLPSGVMSAHRACSLVLKRPRGSYVGIKQVHLVLTTYAKGEPMESRGDYSAGTPPQTLVWVVEVHAKAINMVFSVPPGTHPPVATDYAVVMNAKTGRISDVSLGRGWPLPMGRVGTMISLSARC